MHNGFRTIDLEAESAAPQGPRFAEYRMPMRTRLSIGFRQLMFQPQIRAALVCAACEESDPMTVAEGERVAHTAFCKGNLCFMSTSESPATLLKLLSQVTHAFERELNRELRTALREDLRPAHYAVFRYLAPEGSRISALAEEAGMTQQSMGELVTHMQQCGYVERRIDPDDRRARLVVLTAAGEAALATAAERIRQIEQKLAIGLGERASADLQRSLSRVHELLIG